MTDPEARTWEMFATRRQNPNSYPFFMYIGPEKWVRRLAPKADRVLRVRLIEDRDGEYRGWIPSGRTQKPQQVNLARAFNVPFAYDHYHKQAKNLGEIVFLRIEAIED